MGQNILSQSDCRIFQSTVSPEQISEIPDFMHVDTNLHKSWSENFWMGMARNGCDQSDHRTLKLAVSQEWIDEITDFLHGGANSGRQKVISMIFGWVWSKLGAWSFSSWDLKSAE